MTQQKGNKNSRLFSRMAECWQRARHVRGFGVHSPFAYMLVKDIIRPLGIYGYYGYYTIDCITESKPRAIHTPQGDLDAGDLAKLILRLVATLHPGNVFLSESLPRVISAAVKEASPGIALHRKLNEDTIPALTVVEASHPAVAQIPDFLAKDGNMALLIAPSPQLCSDLFDSLSEGLLLEGKRVALLVARSKMQKQHILI